MKSKHDIKVRDVWESTHGRQVKVMSIIYDSADGRERVRFNTVATGAPGTCLSAGFVSHRKLIERGGQPVKVSP